MTRRRQSWRDANRERLLAEVARVSVVLGGASGRIEPAKPAAADPAFRVDLLAERLSLTPFERDVLLLAVGVELDSAVAAAAATADPRGAGPTAALALGRLPGAHWDAFSPEGALRRWSLLGWDDARNWLHAPFEVDRALFDWLIGIADHSTEPARSAASPPGDAAMPQSWMAVADAIAARLRAGQPSPVIVVAGGDEAGRIAVAREAIARVGMSARVIDPRTLPLDPAARRVFASLWERELLLAAVLPVISSTGDAVPMIDAFGGPLIVTGPVTDATRPMASFELPEVDHADRVELWSRALAIPPPSAPLRRLAFQFAISPSDIAHAAGETPTGGTEQQRIDHAWMQARVRTRRDVGENVRRVVSAASLDDLVLPDAQLRSLDTVMDQVRNQAIVYGSWGLGGKSRRGQGITALFSGPSGSGKTTAAEAMAGALGLDLLHVDLSQVISKYIGETNKNLERVFAAAEAGGAVLLFDEADAIFGKRSEVKDSHDRYANMEVSYLLQRMETYRGLAILTTNQKGGLDDAFLRRIRFVVHFPFPDRALREELWRRALPAALLSSEPDWAELARLSLAGGSIRNIALNAAFLAAAEGRRIAPEHIRCAVSSEGAKTESTPVPLQLARIVP